MNHVKLSKGEHRMVLESLYAQFGALSNAYSHAPDDRRLERRLRTKARALARLINKLEGRQALELEISR